MILLRHTETETVTEMSFIKVIVVLLEIKDYQGLLINRAICPFLF